MSEAREFFRHCPACGRRFHIKLVEKTLVDERKETVTVRQGIVNPMPTGYSRGSAPTIPVVVEEDLPITISVEDFQYSYKCKHCGHEWSETHTEETKE